MLVNASLSSISVPNVQSMLVFISVVVMFGCRLFVSQCS